MKQSYKKNKDIQVDSPIVFFDTFLHDSKTHYVICQTARWQLGYMQGCHFNCIYK
jgi:hypothetical protein